MTRLTVVDPASATGETAELFAAVKSKMGGVPNLLRVLGNSPAVLKAYLGLSEALAGTRFTAREREAIALTVAAANGCTYCASAHTAIAKGLKASDLEIQGWLRGRADDERLQAVLTFTAAVVDRKGFVDDADLRAARDAGLDDREIIEIVTLAVANILTNYANHVAATDVDFPVVTL